MVVVELQQLSYVATGSVRAGLRSLASTSFRLGDLNPGPDTSRSSF